MFNDLVIEYGSLMGIAALITVIINVLKWRRVIPDGYAPAISGGLNLVVLIAMYALRIFKPDFIFADLDPIAMEIATVANFILQYFVSIGTSKVAHSGIKDVPIIGFSYTTLNRKELIGP